MDNSTPTHVAILTVSTMRDGAIYDYATEDRAQAAIEAFGHAVTVERVDNGEGVQLHVTCRTQRGPGGAFAMHEWACAYGIPVHVA